MATITTRKWTYKGTIREAYRVTYKGQSGKTVTKQFDRRKDAAAFAKTCEALAPVDRSRVTIEQAAQRWLDVCEKGLGGNVPVERSTHRSYESHVRIHINPALGQLTLSETTSQVCARFRDELIQRVSRVLAKRILQSLKAILTQAVTDGSIRLNPARDLKVAMSKRDKEMVAIPTIEEMRTLFAKVDELSRNPIPWLAKSWRRYRAMIYLTAFTGLRASEMRGVPWTNVDLAKGILKVTQRADEDRQIGRPKSAAGYREISLAPEMVKMLLDWKGECPPGVNKLVFPNGLGNVENLANIHRRCWYPLQERAGIVAPGTGEGSYSWHSLRHFRASVLIASGATPKEIMTEMGHSSITMTFNTYGHLFPDTKGERKRRAEAIEQSILG